MRPFRRRRADVGTFAAPPPRPEVSDEHLVDESRMIAHSAVRMALKNQIIVDALRDRVDFDPDRVAGVARGRLAELAEQEAETAERLKRSRDERRRRPRDLFDDQEQKDPLRAEKARRAGIIRQLAAALNADLTNREVVAELVERARQDAWDEIQSSVRRRAAVVAPHAPDERYVDERLDRMGALVAFDLTALADERGIDLDSLG